MLKPDDKGLIPAIIQDANTGQVLMLGYVSPESLRLTLDQGHVWFYSRSRQELWHKGATSGSYLNLRSVTSDCDEDALLVQVEPAGPVCHTGAQSCFFNPVTEPQWDSPAHPEPFGSAQDRPVEGSHVLQELWQVILERRRTMPEGSYTASVLKGGVDRAGQKVIEEAGEAVIAAKNADPQAIASEMADLWFHSLLLLAAAGVPPQAVCQELERRRR
ncbi:MAG: bifunctional phosphoribosyl-AMP cyclohydrolase/phosphoribosyl-ATP diphosphatase HisIE [Chloroflexi bacterium]|nr:bifunctional phosphoribosyl-AMP cyclohydrolase/phosphoribosyl-ATP diphosphatase HisIE [Chloroflexota bacterium]